MKYHLGTVSFLTIVKLIFKPIRMFTRPLYESLASSNQKNFFVRFLQVACVPCVWLHHKLIRYLTKSASIQMNMWSSNFGVASKQSYYLVKVRHGDRGQGNEQLIEFVLRQMKISISLVGALIFQLYVSYIPYSPSIKNIKDVANPFVGSVITFCFGLFVASAYTGPYDMIIRSIVHCHFMDEEMFVGDQKFSAVQGTQLTEQGEEENGEKASASIFAELMGYWKKGADDDNLNAAAKELKKKEMVKEDIDLDDLYKKVPDGDEDDDNGPSSEEDNGPGQDIFTENKKSRLNKEQDFDEDFLKKPKEPDTLKQLAKPLKPKTEFEAEAEMDSSMERREKGVNKDLKGLMADKSDESFEFDQPKPVVIFNTIEDEKKEGPRDLPKPILKNSARFIDDDNKSMKSSISKKRKVEIKEHKDENSSDLKKLNENDDDNKSMKSNKSKFSSKVKLTRKNPNEQKPVIEFKTALEDLNEESKPKSVVVSEEKPPELSKPLVSFTVNKEDETDKMSAKMSLKSKKTNKSSLKPKESEPSPERTLPVPNKNTLSPDFKANFDEDDDTKSKKSLRKKLGKSPGLANNSETMLFKDAADDDDKKSAKLSIKSKKSNRNQSALQPSLERKKEDPPKPAASDNKALALLEKLRANRQANEFKVEDDDFENVVDKNPSSIKILNASQGSIF
jgi:hypothetical protein